MTGAVQNADRVSQWAADISEAVRTASSRPQCLLVFVNPFGGARKAGKIWQQVAPVFQLTGELLANPNSMYFQRSKYTHCEIFFLKSGR